MPPVGERIKSLNWEMISCVQALLAQCQWELHLRFHKSLKKRGMKKEILTSQEMLDFLHTSNPNPARSGRVISQGVYKLHRPGVLVPKATQVVRCSRSFCLLKRCWSQTGKWTRFSLTQVLNSTAFFKSQEVSCMKLIQMRNESDLRSSSAQLFKFKEREIYRKVGFVACPGFLM